MNAMRIGGIFLLVLVFAMIISRAASAATALVTLKNLENRIESNMRLRSAGDMIEAANHALRYRKSMNGMQFFVANAFGPRRDVLNSNIIGQSLRDTQQLGIRVPMFGTSDTQRQDEAEAAMKVSYAKADLQRTRMSLLTALREYYVMYWVARKESVLAISYGDALRFQERQVRSLRSIGFWTDSDYFHYLDERERAKTDLRQAKFTMQQSLSMMHSIIGRNIQRFIPLKPSIEKSCLNDIASLRHAALIYNPELQDIRSQLRHLKIVQKYDKNESVNANFSAKLATTIDQNMNKYKYQNPVGYNATVGVELLMPVHARLANKSYAKEIFMEFKSYEDVEKAKKSEIISNVQKYYDDILNVKEQLRQAEAQDRLVRETLREGIIRFNNETNTTLSNVQSMISEKYAAERNSVEIQGNLLIKSYNLLAIAPKACA